nr:uncharacterized protein LOC106614820 isoform X2 [Bactrocera oleae]
MNKSTVGLLSVALYLSSYLAVAAPIEELLYPAVVTEEYTALKYSKRKVDAKQNKRIEKIRRQDQDNDNTALLINLQNALHIAGLSNAQKRDLYAAIRSLNFAAQVKDGYFKKAAHNDALATLISVLWP